VLASERRVIGRRPAASRSWFLAAMLAASAGSAQAVAAQVVGTAVEMDSAPLVDPRRLAELAPVTRTFWVRYFVRSRSLSARDWQTLRAERTALADAPRLPAPTGRDFAMRESMTSAWLRTDEARRLLETLISYQTPSGGWAKAVDFTKGPRRPGQSYSSQTTDWHFTPTIDNDATTDELRLLALAVRELGDARYRAALERGLAYLLDAQMPNGCWPQVFPLQGGYHDAVTFNDGANVRVATLLGELARAEPPVLPVALRTSATEAQRRAVSCFVHAQTMVDGTPTIWGQQHDPLTLAPTSGRSYELASLAPDESARIAMFLMQVSQPGPDVARAVHAAAAWFRANRIPGHRYERWQLTADSTAGPLWPRMSEIGTNRPIFSNRDGAKLYDFTKLQDRATGYRWFTTTPALFLEQYERWAAEHPRA
jgi:PelA/Pel-15E family pectate lyase